VALHYPGAIASEKDMRSRLGDNQKVRDKIPDFICTRLCYKCKHDIPGHYAPEPVGSQHLSKFNKANITKLDFC
jgi:hypothetical protein